MTTSLPGNQLGQARSAYLRSAAHQPIHWCEWSDAAFDRARAEDKPVLLDIGAVWCHWCHVMDGESYENEEIARLINDHFVAVKVDRDERPDIDSRMQVAVQAVSGQGGWPLTAFLTPDGKPFFGGTYFPPDDRDGRPGFHSVLQNIAAYYQNSRAEIVEQAGKVAEVMASAETASPKETTLSPALLEEILDSIAHSFDVRNGGFGTAPKFPHCAAVDLLLNHHQQSGETWALTIAETTLTKMARGGVCDQIGGGFHRYSTDAHWTVPHFEKMSYDNSELLKNYLHGYQVTGNPFYRETAEGIIGWINSVLSDQARGGFFASQDADIDMHDDGDFFTWTVEELNAALSPEEAEVLRLHFGVEAIGDMHHNSKKNVLEVAMEPREISARLDLPEERVRELMASGKKRLLAERNKRKIPFVDPTIYINWNAMMISAFLEAAEALDRPDCREFALKTLDRLVAAAYSPEQGMFHSLVDEEARIDGLVEDQIQMAQALLDAYQATLQKKYFDVSERLMQRAIEQYWDDKDGGFFDVPSSRSGLGALATKRKPFQDSPTPAANPAAALVLERLYHFTENALYREKAEAILKLYSEPASRYGLYAATYGLALSLHFHPPTQILILGEDDGKESDAFVKESRRFYRNGKAVLRLTPARISKNNLPPALLALAKNLPRDLMPCAFVCSGFTCSPPARSPAALAEILSPPHVK